MIKAYIRLEKLRDIEYLYENARKCDYELILQSGGKQLNPKSTMGIFSIGVSKTVALIARTDNRDDFINRFGELING